MTPQGKLKLLLIRQFAYAVLLVLVFTIAIGFPDYGVLIAILLLIAARRLSRGVERTLRETDVRLTLPQKHIYFGAGLVYFFAAVVLMLWYAVGHSSPPVWSLAGLVLVVLLVMLYAGADVVYRSKSRV
jgi:hypothetical protein